MPFTDREKEELFQHIVQRLRRSPGSRGVISHRDLKDVGPADHQPMPMLFTPFGVPEDGYVIRWNATTGRPEWGAP